MSKVTGFTAPSLVYDSVVAVETAQLSRTDCCARPIGGVSDDGPYDYEIPAQADSYLNMSQMFVHGQAKVVKGDGEDMAAGANCALVNLFGTMFVQSVEVRVNDHPLPGSSSTDVNYKAYLETLTNYDDTSAALHLQPQIFGMDTSKKFNTLGADNAGFVARQPETAESRTFDWIAPVPANLLRSNCHLGPKDKLSLKVYRASDAFLIMSGVTQAYKLKIIKLDLRYSRIMTSIPRPLREIHIMPHTELMRFPMAGNVTNIMLNLQQGGKLPRQIVVFFVRTGALNGAYDLNPLLFQHMNVAHMVLRVNGRSVPTNALETDFANGLTAPAYTHMLQNLGAFRTGKPSLITKSRWLDGYTIFPFDLSPDNCGGYHIHQGAEGTLELEARCGTGAPAQACTAMVYMVWDMELNLDQGSGMHSLAYVDEKK